MSRRASRATRRLTGGLSMVRQWRLSSPAKLCSVASGGRGWLGGLRRRKFFLVAGFGGMHPVGWQLVGASGECLNLQSIKMIKRHAALADGVALFDGFGYVGLGERGGFDQAAPGGKLGSQRGSKGTTGAMHV